MDELSEQAWIEKAKQGETAAFGRLVSQHGQFAFNLAVTILHDDQEAEDVAQEAFVRAWQALPRFKGNASFRTWLYRIITNLCYSRLPRLRTDLQVLHEETLPLLADKRPSAEHQMLAAEQEAALQHAISQLPSNYRLLILLRHQHELSYQEIAEITQLPLGTVKTIIFRARRRLKKALAISEERVT